MEYTENIIITVRLRKPEKLNFISGLKCDTFGMVSSKLDKSFVYMLPEGNWLGEKTADTVVPMLQNIIMKYGTKNSNHKVL